MKRIGYFLIGMMLLVGACTTSFAQSHRHAQRNDSTEKVIMEENAEAAKKAKSDAYNAGFEDGEDFREFVDETVSDALEDVGLISGDREGRVVREAIDGGILLAIIAVVGIFFGPAIILAIILFFIYKRKKQRDQVVMAAINKGVDVPAGYGGNYSGTTSSSATPSEASRYNKSAVKDNSMMHKGIKDISIGLGLVVLAAYLHINVLVGIGWMVVILGVGKIAIAYFSGDKTTSKEKEEPKYTRTVEKVQEDEKSE